MCATAKNNEADITPMMPASWSQQAVAHVRQRSLLALLQGDFRRSRIESRAGALTFNTRITDLSKLPTFGFSAFLKLISLNETPQRSALRERYKPTDGKGYDYHRSLRLALQKINGGTHSAAEVLSSLNSISKMPERHSAKRGVVRFLKWRKLHTGHVSSCDPVIIESPTQMFRVRFEADCVIEVEGRRTAIHVWNTKRPELSRNLVLAALTLVQRQWPKDQDTVDDFAVLSLQDHKLYRWSEHPNAYGNAANALMQHIERLCAIMMNEIGSPTTVEIRDKPGADA